MLRLIKGQVAAFQLTSASLTKKKESHCDAVSKCPLSRIHFIRLLCLTGGILASAMQLGNPATAAADSSLVYVTPRGVTYTVTEKGLSSIRKGFGSVVDGEWTAFNGDSWFKDAGEEQVPIPAPTEMTLEVVSPKQAKVRHVSGDVVCTYDYSFDEEDVVISCRFENNSQSGTIQVLGFSGLKFHFARPPEGIMAVENKEFFQTQGLAACHPSSFSPIGGSYAADKDLGFGLSPWNSSFFRTLLLWDYADWEASERNRPLERVLKYFANSPVPPGGAATVGLKLRVSGDMQWQTLLQPYREAFTKLHGEVQYKSDGRWIASETIAAQEGVAETPARRSETTRRFEATRRPDEIGNRNSRSGARTAGNSAGAQQLCDTLIPRLLEAGGQGAIFWQQAVGESEDSGAPADFNVMTPDSEADWERIDEQFSASGLKFGVATSPRKISVRKNFEERASLRVNPHDTEHVDLVLARYQEMVDRSCKLFYLADFGDSLEDVLLMKQLRAKLGDEIQTYADRPCDVMMVYSGGYTGTVLKTASSAGLERGYRMTVSEKNWQIFQWLAPKSELLGQLTEVKGSLSDALESPERFFYSRHIVSLVPVADFKRLPSIKKLQPQFVSDNGDWLPSGTASN